jgi:[ribosomal protein S5]-alanine N-acetyltransferase
MSAPPQKPRAPPAAPDILETERMIGERVKLGHAEEIIELMLDPRVGNTLWPTPDPPPKIKVIVQLEANIEQWERRGFGIWLLRDSATGEMVGRGGLAVTQVTGAEEVAVDWSIVPERWNQGLATEFARAAVDVAFSALGLQRLISLTLAHNRASRRVMEKAGFHYDRDIEHLGLPHVLYRRSRLAGT